MKKLIAIVAITVLSAVFSMSTIGKKLPSIGYVLVGPHTDGGWSMRHHHGFQSLKKHGYKVSMVEMVPEAESTKIFNKLARRVNKNLPQTCTKTRYSICNFIRLYGWNGESCKEKSRYNFHARYRIQR